MRAEVFRVDDGDHFVPGVGRRPPPPPLNRVRCPRHISALGTAFGLDGGQSRYFLSSLLILMERLEHFYLEERFYSPCMNKNLANLHSTFYINIDDESGQDVPMVSPFSLLSPRLLRIMITTFRTESRATLQ